MFEDEPHEDEVRGYGDGEHGKGRQFAAEADPEEEVEEHDMQQVVHEVGPAEAQSVLRRSLLLKREVGREVVVHQEGCGTHDAESDQFAQCLFLLHITQNFGCKDTHFLPKIYNNSKLLVINSYLYVPLHLYVPLQTKNKSVMIPFNKPYCSGREQSYIQEVCQSTTMSGNGQFTKLCHGFFEKRYGFRKCLLTTSGTDALEMCAMLCELKPGDEVIVPSYTFVSSAIAFLREGAFIRFADSGKDNPNITVEAIEPLINEKTRVIVVVHYALCWCRL